MKLSIYNIALLLLFFSATLNSSCQSNSSNNIKVFEKKPTFDTLLNEFAKPIGYVNDYAKLYTPDQVFLLDSLIYSFEKESSFQIVVVTLDSTMVKASEIDEITAAIGNGWKVGGDSSKGLVVGISKTYRRMRIQNGKYIQKILTDAKTKDVIDSVFIPEFKKDKYFEGTLLGVKALMNELQKSINVKF